MISKKKFNVAVVENTIYPEEFPYNPSRVYPEYPFIKDISQKSNQVYDNLRILFNDLGLDPDNFNTPDWNPLGALIKPGMSVVIKPNFVIDKHPQDKPIFSIITHPSLIRATADFCWIALKGQGEIIITDTPQADCNWENLQRILQISDIINFYSKFEGPTVKFYDLRDFFYEEGFNPKSRHILSGDPRGSVIINLKERSEFFNHPHPEKFYGSDFNRQECISHHSGVRQEYQIANTILNADVFISVPKMKVHKKVGVTLNIKGLVGICTNKNFLVHYSLGSPRKGGDQYPDGLFNPVELFMIRIERFIYDSIFASSSVVSGLVYKILYPVKTSVSKKKTPFVNKKICDSGNWHGNDSAWRMAADLAKIIYFADKNGVMQDTPQRKFFSVVDGIIGGEKNGPLSPDPKYSGVMIGGDDLVAVDLATTYLMGFDPTKIRQFSIIHDKYFDFGIKEFSDIKLIIRNERSLDADNNRENYGYKPHPGWKGHIERLKTESSIK